MGDVTPLKRKKKATRKLIKVCWGGYGVKETSEHVAVKCELETDVGLLVIEEDGGALKCFPIGGVFHWSEQDVPDES